MLHLVRQAGFLISKFGFSEHDFRESCSDSPMIGARPGWALFVPELEAMPEPLVLIAVDEVQVLKDPHEIRVKDALGARRQNRLQTFC